MTQQAVIAITIGFGTLGVLWVLMLWGIRQSAL